MLNTIASLSNEIITVIAGFILPRLILESYGSNVNGLVSSISQFLGFISFCELGIGAVIKSNLYKPLAEKDNDSLSRIIKSAKKFFRKIALLLLIYTVCLAFVYPFIVQKQFDFLFTFSLIIIISISSFAQYYFGIVYQILLVADQIAYIQLIINSIAVLFNTIICAVLMKLGCSIHLIKLTTAILFTMRPVLMARYVKHHYNIDPNITLVGEPIKQKWNGFSQHLATIIQDNTDIVILTLFSTLKNVSIYSVYVLVINGIRQLIYTVNSSITSLIGDMIAKNEIHKLNQTFAIFEWGMHTISVLLFTITGVMIIPFIRIYTNGIMDVNYINESFAILITIAGALRCIQLTYNIIVQSAGHFKETQNSALAEPLINILISIIMVKQYGLIGVTIGTIISLSYRMVYLVLYLKNNILKRAIKPFLRQISVDLCMALLIIFVTRQFSFEACNYMQWIFIASKVTLISCVCCVMVQIVFYHKYTVSLLKKVFKFKSKEVLPHEK